MSSDTGTSSRAIVARMEGSELDNHGFSSHPSDPSDLGRCIRLLDKIPEYRERLLEMCDVSITWAMLVTHWDELEAFYREEESSGKAPKCYARMQELIEKSGFYKSKGVARVAHGIEFRTSGK